MDSCACIVLARARNGDRTVRVLRRVEHQSSRRANGTDGLRRNGVTGGGNSNGHALKPVRSERSRGWPVEAIK